MYLTGCTLFVFYGLQGFYIHGSPDDVKGWVWLLEAVSWAFRAFVEVSAIAYLNETKPNSKFEGFLIVVFDFLLIGLILLTGSVVIQASATGQSPHELLGDNGLRWWAYGVAAYGPLMLASMSFSYKVMPVAINERQPVRRVSGKLPKVDRPAGGKLTGKRGKSRQVGRKLAVRPTSADQWNRKIPLAEVRPIVEANPNISGPQLAEALGGVVSKTTANAMREDCDCLSIIAANGSGKGE
jgi:hypothetical protein